MIFKSIASFKKFNKFFHYFLLKSAACTHVDTFTLISSGWLVYTLLYISAVLGLSVE